jgi:hypothetical protein
LVGLVAVVLPTIKEYCNRLLPNAITSCQIEVGFGVLAVKIDLFLNFPMWSILEPDIKSSQ